MPLGRGSLAAVALSALGASGCVVFGPFETRPPMSGQLVTAADGKAVAGAEVVVDTYTWVHDKVGSKATRTDADGRWSVPRRLEWQFALMGVPEGPFWAQEVTFRSGDRVSTFAGFDLDHRKDSGVVTGDAWQPRFDARRRNKDFSAAGLRRHGRPQPDPLRVRRRDAVPQLLAGPPGAAGRGRARD